MKRKDINQILAEAVLGESHKKSQNKLAQKQKGKNNDKSTVGSAEEAVKAYNKANREAEQDAQGGVLNFKHPQTTKTKKGKKDQKDSFSRKCKHKGGCFGDVCESVEYELTLNESELPDDGWDDVYKGIDRQGDKAHGFSDSIIDNPYDYQIDDANPENVYDDSQVDLPSEQEAKQAGIVMDKILRECLRASYYPNVDMDTKRAYMLYKAFLNQLSGRSKHYLFGD